MLMDVSIVIPNFNGKNLLEKNLSNVVAAAKGYKNGKVEIIVTDDASTDDSVEYLKKFAKDVDSIKIMIVESQNRKDGGFSKNVNRGVKLATGEIVVLLNSDVSPHKDFLTPLLSHFKNEKMFAVGCMDESVENGQIVLRGRGIGKWERGFLMHSRGEVDKTDTLWVSGGSGAFRRNIWNELGGLNEILNPFYWEDIDLSYRAQKSGYEIKFEPKSRVVHEHSKGTIKAHFNPTRVKKTVYRNQFLFVWLNITDRNLMLSHIIWLPYHLLKALQKKEWTMITGFAAALGLMDKVRIYRQMMEKHFVKSDREILAPFAS